MKNYPLPLLICLFLTALSAHAQGEIVDFDSERWDILDGEVVEHLGRKALLGTATLKDVQFTDGVIEVDIAGNGFVRSYPGIVFRKQSDTDLERFYIRPHRGGGCRSQQAATREMLIINHSDPLCLPRYCPRER